MSGIDDPEIAERKVKRETKKAEDQHFAATMAERLTQRGQAKTVDVVLTDPDGDLVIPMRLPTWRITCELTQIEVMMVNKTGRKKLAKIMTDLSADSSMNEEFWNGETIGLVDMKLLIEGLTEASTKRMKEAKQFR